MRLQPHEADAIRAAVREVFGETATIRLFGSRLRDDLKGGDLDLFVEIEPGQASVANEQRLRDPDRPRPKISARTSSSTNAGRPSARSSALPFGTGCCCEP